MPAVLGVLGELTALSELLQSNVVLNTSGLKSGPKKVFPVTSDFGVKDAPVCGVRGVLGVALASDPKSSSASDTFIFRSL